jgi:hypothetical protein
VEVDGAGQADLRLDAEHVGLDELRAGGRTHTIPMSQLKPVGLQRFTGPQRIVEFTVRTVVLSTTINRSILSLTYRI